jgi:trans-2,3-dihydro-3-hydroxyanthranilate isomerase
LPIGVLEVTASGNTWTLRAGDPKARKVEAARIELASMLGLEVDEIAERTLWVNTGVEQLIVPLTSKAALERVRPAPELLQRHAQLSADRYLVYVYTELGEDRVRARFFFKKGMSVVEDPATGSACANLGGYFVTTQARLPLQRTIEQGQHTGRPSRLMLRVDAQSRIFVSGAVLELGRGSVTL